MDDQIQQPVASVVLSLAVMLAIMLPPNAGLALFFALFLLLGLVTSAQGVG